MLISHLHGFVFVRCRKTASTSTEIFLSRFLGDEDVITAFSPRDELLRIEAGGRPPQNTGEGDTTFHNHMPADAIRETMSGAWDRYFTFCFDRNPWDKVISLYFHRHKAEPRISLDQFLESGEALDARNIDLYSSNGSVIVDFVGRYERLMPDLAWACARIGIPPPVELAAAKSQFRRAGTHYRSLLNPWQRDFIARAFADEIELHEYLY
jgi:hypothetical protein